MNDNTSPPTDERGGLPSASSFQRLVFCPGSRAAEAAIPHGTIPASDLADAGTRIHDALKTGEIEDLAHNEEQIASKLKEMEEAALAEFCDDFSLEIADMEIIREERFWIAGVTSARVDFAAVHKRLPMALLLDSKTGFLKVTGARENWQLRVGICALNETFGPFETARVAIAQYRLKERFSKCDYDATYLKRAKTEILFYDARSKEEDAPFAAGPWCQYCRAKPTCPTMATYALLPSVFAKTIELKKKDIIARVDTLSLPDLAFIQSRKTFAENLFEAVTKRLKSLPIEELESVGLTLVPTGTIPSIPSIADLWRVLDDAGLISDEEFRGVCKVGLGALYDLLVTRIAGKRECSKSEAEQYLDGLLAPVVKRTPKEPSLKPIKS